MYDLSIRPSKELSGAVRRRLVGAALRRYREHLGYRLEEAANILECDRSKISRIETGQRGIHTRDLRDLLTEYGISESEQLTLTAIADPRSARRGWWQEYADIVPAVHRDLMIMETLASEIMIYDAQQIPDLLQTQDYARAVAQSDPDTSEPGTLDRLGEMNATRRQVIMNERCTPVTAVIGEGALRQQAGNTGVMRHQARWLSEVSGICPWITLQILPFRVGADPKGTAPMSILRFAQAPSLGVVHLRGLNGGVCLIDQAALTCHIRAFNHLQVSALPPHQSAQLIREMAGTKQ
jgi:transcriptional regulator with XRE-family HTH domain